MVFLLRSSVVEDKSREEAKKSICPMLEFICKNGNATVYEWRTGTTPKEVRKEKSLCDANLTKRDGIEVRCLLFGLYENF